MSRHAFIGEVTQLVECHLVEVEVGGSNPLFLTAFRNSYMRPLGGMVDTADSKSAFCWFKSDRGQHSIFSKLLNINLAPR